MKKRERAYNIFSLLEKILYKSLFILVSFLINVGEGTKFIFLIPIRFIVFLYAALTKIPPFVYRFLRRFSFSFGRAIDRLIVLFNDWFNSIKKIKLPKLSINLPKMPKKIVKKRFIISRFIFKLRYFIFGFLTAAIIVFANNSYIFIKSLPSPKNIGKINFSLSTHIYDRNGKLLFEFYREQNRTPVRLSSLPQYVSQAAIAIEDKDFFRHNGVSPIGGIIRALKENIFNRQFQGGSTITQQLVKSALLTPERTVQRKIKEIILALWTERLFTKQEILEMYLNQVPYGGSSYGIEEASKTYFNKHAKDLDISEAAFLAGLPQAPSLYSPYVNPELAIQRESEVLKKMQELGYITKAQYLKEKQKKLTIATPKTAIKAPHFVFYVKNTLVNQFGIRTVEEGGLRATTSLDLNLQEKVEEILKEELEKIRSLNVTNGAILITKPQTGEIIAMVGSVDYFENPSGAFNVTVAQRQPGSSIKPLMYSLALEKDYTAATILDDSPVVFSNQGTTPYKPVNYDGKFHGRVPLRYALASSYNVPAVRVLNTLGVRSFVNHARRMGISTWGDSSRFGLALTLGGGEVTMVDMAKAFGVFANLGERVELTPILKVTNVSDETLYESEPVKRRVISTGVSYVISDILSDNDARRAAFGARSALEIPGNTVAVKTGTTDDKKDNWTIGYTPEFLVAVWVGNNNNTPMHPFLTSGITGAAPIWNRVMTYLLTDYSNHNSWFGIPDDIVEKTCYGGKREYFLRGTENKVTCARFIPNPTPTAKPN